MFETGKGLDISSLELDIGNRGGAVSDAYERGFLLEGSVGWSRITMCWVALQLEKEKQGWDGEGGPGEGNQWKIWETEKIHSACEQQQHRDCR